MSYLYELRKFVFYKSDGTSKREIATLTKRYKTSIHNVKIKIERKIMRQAQSMKHFPINSEYCNKISPFNNMKYDV